MAYLFAQSLYKISIHFVQWGTLCLKSAWSHIWDCVQKSLWGFARRLGPCITWTKVDPWGNVSSVATPHPLCSGCWEFTALSMVKTRKETRKLNSSLYGQYSLNVDGPIAWPDKNHTNDTKRVASSVSSSSSYKY